MKTPTLHNDELELVSQTINDKLCDGTILIGYGKRGHGMNGKDADLDSIGQCLVKSLETVDPVHADNMKVLIHLHLYATVCAPSHEGIDLEAVKENASPELKEYFLSNGVDLNRTEEELYDDEDAFDTIVDYFQEQATLIAIDADPCPHDPMAFMWNDDAWEGGIDITLEVPLTVDEYDAIESGAADHYQLPPLRKAMSDAALANDVEAITTHLSHFKDAVEAEKKCQATLDDVAQRIAAEIHDANRGGTPERDKLKRFEEEVALWNKLINQLECYHQPAKA